MFTDRNAITGITLKYERDNMYKFPGYINFNVNNTFEDVFF